MELKQSNQSSGIFRQSALSWTVLAVVSLTGLAACGGGGSSNTAASAVMPAVTTPKSCANVAGNLDAVQSALTTTLAPAAAQIPVVGGAASSATTALSRTLDAVDGVATAVSTLSKTSNPQMFTAQLNTVGDSLLCSGSSLSDSLARLASSSTVPVPGIDQVQATLADVSKKISDGLVGAAPGGDLTALTNQLVALSTQLKALSSNLPTQVNQPFLAQILALNATGFNSAALILNDLGQLNASKLSGDITTLLQIGATALPGTLASQFGVPASTLTPVVSQFQLAAQTTGSALTTVTAPTFQAVSAVLGATGGTTAATSTFSDLLDGSLSSVGNSQPRVTQLTQQLNGGAGVGSLLTQLTQAFGGKLPI